jgi:hypothetical protein
MSIGRPLAWDAVLLFALYKFAKASLGTFEGIKSGSAAVKSQVLFEGELEKIFGVKS